MTSWITLLSLCLACAALLLSVNGDTPECLHSVEDCEGKPVGKTNYRKCGTCDRFIRCKKKAKEILCPAERPVFDVSGKCKPKATAVCRGLTYKENLMPIDITVDGERVTVPLTQPDLERVCRGKDTFLDGFIPGYVQKVE